MVSRLNPNFFSERLLHGLYLSALSLSLQKWSLPKVVWALASGVRNLSWQEVGVESTSLAQWNLGRTNELSGSSDQMSRNHASSEQIKCKLS